jgi:DNA-binding transcriptional ArsR family regulator
MLMTLLREGGKRSIEELAEAILAHDESQVEYYEDVTNNMVGRVLKSHGIVEKEDDGYYLIGYGDLDDEQVERLIELCEAKLDEYKTKRGKRIWQHREASAGYVSGTLRAPEGISTHTHPRLRNRPPEKRFARPAYIHGPPGGVATSSAPLKALEGALNRFSPPAANGG